MRKSLFKPLGQALVAAFVFLGSANVWAQARTSVETFFQNPAFSAGKLSPNGRYVALTVAPKGARTQLVVLDTEKLAAKAIAAPVDSDVDEFHWVNDERLIFSLDDRQTADGDNILGPGLFAVNRDGSEYRALVERGQPWVRELGERRDLNAFTWFLATTRHKNSDDIFVLQPRANRPGEPTAVSILRLNTRTGRTLPYSRPGNSIGWLIGTDDVPRATLTYEGGRLAVHYLDPKDEKWRQLADFEPFKAEGFYPAAFGPDGTLYVHANNGRDKSSLYRFDFAKGEVDPEPVVSVAGYDFTGALLVDKSRFLGVHYVSDAKSTVWLEPEFKALQAKIDALLPTTVNIVDVPIRAESPHVLVRSFSDVDPGAFMLFNTRTDKLTVLGQTMRDIDPRQMGRRDMVRYKARDGLEIPAWLTLPKDGKGKKLPMVVLVHGGPWVRGGEWGWNTEAQFFASRGYAVLEPEFRGSAGYGFRHFSAGFKQWGLAMQNDIADGARWAVAQGIADGSRICIAGASYGGYSASMGLINDPDLFRCGINWVGVTDIDLMFSPIWGAGRHAKTFNMHTLLGDPEKDVERFKATSALQQASRIKQPLLLAYGGADRRVPIVHGVRLRDAVQKTNPHVEWVEYVEEGHGWFLVKNRVDFWTRVEKFLERNIGSK
jgi:dipeptidyl aminopeptidase/acylaminoacyl peptidase